MAVMVLLRLLTRVYSSDPDYPSRDLFVRRPPVLRDLPASPFSGSHLEFHSLGYRSVRNALRDLVRAAHAVSACCSANRNHGACCYHVRSRPAAQVLYRHHHVRTYQLNYS